MLSRLSSASGDFLGDTELVENLETTKSTAAEIEDKVLLLLTSTFNFVEFILVKKKITFSEILVSGVIISRLIRVFS